MDPNQAAITATQLPPVDPNFTFESLASLIDYELLGIGLTAEDVQQACARARQLGVAAVVVRPSDIDEAVRVLGDGPVRVASVAGYPDGFSLTGAKLWEGRDLLRRGAREIEFTVNIGKMHSREFQFVEMELLQMARSCQESGALLKVRYRNEHLSADLKIILTKICRRVEAAFAVIDPTPADLELLQPLLKERLQLKATAVQSLDHALELRAKGFQRMASADAPAILEAWRSRLAARAEVLKNSASAAPPATPIGGPRHS